MKTSQEVYAQIRSIQKEMFTTKTKLEKERLSAKLDILCWVFG